MSALVFLTGVGILGFVGAQSVRKAIRAGHSVEDIFWCGAMIAAIACGLIIGGAIGG